MKFDSDFILSEIELKLINSFAVLFNSVCIIFQFWNLNKMTVNIIINILENFEMDKGGGTQNVTFFVYEWMIIFLFGRYIRIIIK